jgi:hypothetical protein
VILFSSMLRRDEHKECRLRESESDWPMQGCFEAVEAQRDLRDHAMHAAVHTPIMYASMH